MSSTDMTDADEVSELVTSR